MATSLLLSACCLALMLAPIQAVHNVNDYGAVADKSGLDTEFQNARAFNYAIGNATADGSTDRTVLIPAGSQYFSMPISLVSNANGLTMQLDGDVIASANMTEWPITSKKYQHFWQFQNCTDLTIEGSGTMYGQGWDWWLLWLFNKQPKGTKRPKLVVMGACTNVVIRGIRAENSPSFHFDLSDSDNLLVDGVTVHVDVEKQRHMLAQAGMLSEAGLPLFPLNTDGIDPSGRNIHIRNVTIENFDDAVAVKPSNGHSRFPCTENVLVENARVSFGVGMSIGSVPPSRYTNCIRNVTFRNVEYQHPIKAIYIKTDPGTEGDGIISNITYENIYAETALWYPIWIGPQQQQQPGTAGTGCSFLYPIVDKCPTNPNVPIRNVTLRNVTLVKGITLPGVILCNETNPCTNINFDGVSNSGSFLVQKDYVCKSALGTVTGSSPVPGCLGGGDSSSSSSSTGGDKTHEDTKRSLFQRIRNVLHDLHV